MTDIDPKQIEKECKVKDIPESLRLVSGSYEVNQLLDRFGIKHDPDSIVLSDSYNCIFYGNNPESGNFEIWVCHKSTPYLEARAYKMDNSELNQHEISMYE